MKGSLIAIILCFVSVELINAQDTERIYLSGTGNNHRVDWEFYCTEGRNSGFWTTIPVPSHWECEGFGRYNYGHDSLEERGKEKGLYRYRFRVPESWEAKCVRIVFEGSMTDTEVMVNGKPAGPVHRGAFYQFSHDITKLLDYYGNNNLKVTVAKHSENESVNDAERDCDFWIFGGIFRPVYLEAKPREHMKNIALDADSDGSIAVNVVLQEVTEADRLSAQVYTIEGDPVGGPFSVSLEKGTEFVALEDTIPSVETWTPETPNLYMLELSLMKKNQTLHRERERFGFRTIEIRDRDGIYVNGTKIKFKGINRHSFWPTSGRVTSKKISIEDVNLIKDMNMNAVRMSHYPPDNHFLDVCDSLGLFVLDELAGWQSAYDTEAGSILAKETLLRDRNHPSVVIWNNGNEGGWNVELDHLFDELDPQQRPLIHPCQVFRKTNTDHYQDYNSGTGIHQHGNKVVFPTEFLHGLYDGGHGAGLEDYWNQMWDNPISAGGFLWDFSDQAILRTDQGGLLDTDGNHGPDGILGPYREKEGSFYAVKEIWSPIFFEKRFITPEFDGKFIIENRYHFTNLKDCKFEYMLVSLPAATGLGNKVNHKASINAPDIPPTTKGVLQLDLPPSYPGSDVIVITAFDPAGREIYTWSWPVCLPEEKARELFPGPGKATVQARESDEFLDMVTGEVHLQWSKTSGFLHDVGNKQGRISFNGGPILIDKAMEFRKIEYYKDVHDCWVVEADYDGDFKKVQWTVYPGGWLKLEVQYFPSLEMDFMGISFSYPEEKVKGIRWMGYGPFRVWKNRLRGNRLDIWEKAYNNTVTGESGYQYPEFKGYHKGFYWATIHSEEQDFDIICASEDVFLRLFTPDAPKGMDEERINPRFPAGDISFMHGINPIGTKILSPERLGPMSQKNIFLNRLNEHYKEVILYFNFTGNPIGQ